MYLKVPRDGGNRRTLGGLGPERLKLGCGVAELHGAAWKRNTAGCSLVQSNPEDIHAGERRCDAGGSRHSGQDTAGFDFRLEVRCSKSGRVNIDAFQRQKKSLHMGGMMWNMRAFKLAHAATKST